MPSRVYRQSLEFAVHPDKIEIVTFYQPRAHCPEQTLSGDYKI